MLCYIFHNTVCRNIVDCCVSYFKDHIDPSPLDAKLDTLTGTHQPQYDDSIDSVMMDEVTGVLVGMASGRMEVKVKVKQTETVPGPKVTMCCTSDNHFIC